MADNGITLILAGLAICTVGLPAALTLLTALLPDYVARSRATLWQRPFRSLALGLVATAVLLALATLIGSDAVPAAVTGALSLTLALPLALLAGLLTAAGIVGEGMWRQLVRRPASLLESLLVGLGVTTLIGLVPILGWLLLAALVTAGIGASLMALVRPKGLETSSTSTPHTANTRP